VTLEGKNICQPDDLIVVCNLQKESTMYFMVIEIFFIKSLY